MSYTNKTMVVYGIAEGDLDFVDPDDAEMFESDGECGEVVSFTDVMGNCIAVGVEIDSVEKDSCKELMLSNLKQAAEIMKEVVHNHEECKVLLVNQTI